MRLILCRSYISADMYGFRFWHEPEWQRVSFQQAANSGLREASRACAHVHGVCITRLCNASSPSKREAVESDPDLTLPAVTVRKQRKDDSALAVASNAVEPRLPWSYVRALSKLSAAVCAARARPPLARLPLELAEPAQERLRPLERCKYKGRTDSCRNRHHHSSDRVSHRTPSSDIIRKQHHLA
jgi:hypothetical protein